MVPGSLSASANARSHPGPPAPHGTEGGSKAHCLPASTATTLFRPPSLPHLLLLFLPHSPGCPFTANTLSQWLWPGFRGSLTSGPGSGSQELPVEVLQGLLSPQAGPRLEAPLPSWRAPLRLHRGLPEAAGGPQHRPELPGAAGGPQHRAASSPDSVPKRVERVRRQCL